MKYVQNRTVDRIADLLWFRVHWDVTTGERGAPVGETPPSPSGVQRCMDECVAAVLEAGPYSHTWRY